MRQDDFLLDYFHGKRDFKEIVFRNVTLIRQQLSELHLNNSLFVYTNWDDADLSNSDLSDNTFKSSGLEGVNLTNTNLSNCVFSDCDLSNIDLSKTNIDNVKLSGCILDGVKISLKQLPDFLKALNITVYDDTVYKNLVTISKKE